MNVTPPEADTEYSTGSGASKPLLRRRLQGNRGRLEQAPGSLRAAILAGSLLGALMLVVAEFTTLFTVHVETSSAPIKTVATGPHHSYALLLIAIVVAALAIAVWRDTQPAGAAGDRAARSSRAADRAPGRPPRRARHRPRGLERDALRRRELDAECRAVPGDARRGRARDHLRSRLHRARIAAPSRRRAVPSGRIAPYGPPGRLGRGSCCIRAGKQCIQRRSHQMPDALCDRLPPDPGVPDVGMLTTCRQPRLARYCGPIFHEARVVPLQPPVPCGGRPSRPFPGSGALLRRASDPDRGNRDQRRAPRGRRFAGRYV